jgi:hypothetical protein
MGQRPFTYHLFSLITGIKINMLVIICFRLESQNITENSVSIKPIVVAKGEFNVVMNREELLGITKYLTL